MKFILVHPEARQRALETVRNAPDGWHVSVQAPTRNNDQNDHLHAVLTDYGQRINWNWRGYQVDLDDLKSIFVAAYRKLQDKDARLLPGLDGKPVLLGWRSRDLTKKECAELIELVYSEIHHAASTSQAG
jgi:hypothetical protein